jgi:hypothetical protein
LSLQSHFQAMDASSFHDIGWCGASNAEILFVASGAGTLSDSGFMGVLGCADWICLFESEVPHRLSRRPMPGRDPKSETCDGSKVSVSASSKPDAEERVTSP